MNIDNALHILNESGIKTIDIIDEIFNECIEDYEYDLPYDDATYSIIRFVKRKYKYDLKPRMIEIRDSGNKKWKYNCYKFVSDYIDSEAEKRGYDI